MYTIKFGTDGWRDIIADTFTVENVRRVAKATSDWLNKQDLTKSVVIGYDCRFGGEMFAKESAMVFADNGIHVILSDGFVSTPMISLAANMKQVGLGIILTASHNPPSYNGFKIKANYGGPATPKTVSEIENLIPDTPVEIAQSSDKYFFELIKKEDFEKIYLDHCRNNFNMEALESMSSHLLYDAMFGAGRKVVAKLLPDSNIIHGDENPGFLGRAPEPILKNLPEASKMLKENEN
ncbi:MAG: phosphoglucomutase/phosphomannomutase family protein, partial [Bacteroidota bacterium]|nr:phosphoglucomutase/phosphomannomutase family protein [Bacteroidota bacterium]